MLSLIGVSKMKQIIKYIFIMATLVLFVNVQVIAAEKKDYILDDLGNKLIYSNSAYDLKYVYPILLEGMGKPFYIKTKDGINETKFWCILVSNQPQSFAENIYTFEVEPDAEPNTLKIALYSMQDESQDKAVEKKINKIYKNLKIKDSYSLYKKVKIIHDWVVKNIEYNEVYRSLFSTLLEGESAKCDGFSSITKKLLDRAGITNRIVVGINNKYELGHAWNMVLMDDGLWYIIDTSMNSKEYAKGKKGMYKNFLQSGFNSYKNLGRLMNEDIQKLKAISPYEVK